MKKKFSIVLPVYGNEKNLPVTVPYIMEHLSLFPEYETEVIMVCDGSPDNSYQLMREFKKQYPDKIKIAKFNKNYGQRAAVNCGMSMADGDVIGVISADLQDPFELFAEMLKYWENGEKLVLAYREKRGEKGLGALCSNLIHRYIHKNINSEYPIGGFDFYVVDRKIAEIFCRSDTPNNSMQLLLVEIAGKPKKIGYTRKERTAGKSGWKLFKKINQTMCILTVYTDKPFWYLIYIGFAVAAAAFLTLICAGLIARSPLLAATALCLIVMGILLSAVGYLGICGFKWMQNLKKTPRYIVEDEESDP